jgi:serine acetyltransferase
LINEKATVGACSFVIKNVQAGATVFGSPAKILL